jgi:hypothetical protein
MKIKKIVFFFFLMLSLSAIGLCHTQEDQSAWSLSGSNALAIIWKMAAEFLSLVGCGGYFMKPTKELGR